MFSTERAFAALKSNGSVVTWGNSSSLWGGNSSSVASQLTGGVTQIFSTERAFAALKSNGSVVTWGNSSSLWGGNSSSVASQLTGGVTQIFSTERAFAALKSNGSVVTWGDSTEGGDSNSVASRLTSGVTQIFSTNSAFAALKSDGSVVTWGGSGGDSSSVASQLTSGVVSFADPFNDDRLVPLTGSSVTLAVSPSTVTEDGTGNLIYTFSRTGVTSNALTVNYTVGGNATNGTDYGNIGTSVTFAANSSTATVTVDPTTDTTVESDETVSLTLDSGTGYTIGTTSAVTGTITNDDVALPTITLAVSPSSVTEDGASNLIYTFTRTGVTSNQLTVNYTVGGTATNGNDYGNIGTSVTFTGNSSTATVTVDPTTDTTVESDETVSLTLASGTGYTIGTTSAVTGTITNDDVALPTITLAVSPSSVTEDGASNLIYTFIRTGVTNNALTVNYTVGGTATFNSDYTQREATSFTATAGTITFAAGASTAALVIDPTSDTGTEGNETVTLALTSGSGYTIGTTSAVNGSILDNDVTPGTVVRTPIAPSYLGKTRYEWRNLYAIAVLKSDGSVVTWGSSSSYHEQSYGGYNGRASQLTSGVTQIFSNESAFAALKSNGSVVTWGDSGYGGDSSIVTRTWNGSQTVYTYTSIASQLTSGVTQIFSTPSAFAALKSDGSVVTWGDSGYGGDSSSVAS
ncbi:MAG: calx-beta domain protein, partial [Cylindrospermopsis raciborskii KL1]|nr:calx-beta domain protein [Cylindrospermopsis raciborskii KL1]